MLLCNKFLLLCEVQCSGMRGKRVQCLGLAQMVRYMFVQKRGPDFARYAARVSFSESMIMETYIWRACDIHHINSGTQVATANASSAWAMLNSRRRDTNLLCRASFRMEAIRLIEKAGQVIVASCNRQPMPEPKKIFKVAPNMLIECSKHGSTRMHGALRVQNHNFNDYKRGLAACSL